jgi:succinyl-CoA synthetase alpha subunit
MAILLNKNSRIIVQGITGQEGSYHAEKCHEYGQNIVGGVTPGKGGQRALDGKVPIFNSCFEAKKETDANVALIFVPAFAAADAILEATDAGIELIVCITESIPVADMVLVKNYIKDKPVRLIGPNCPGVITPDEAKVGIMPGFIHLKGKVGLISRSGTLTYEAVKQLTERGLGQSTCIGIGGDPIIGSQFIDLLALFQEDPDTEAVVMIGEIGGTAEEEAAEFVNNYMTKPVVGFIAGQTAPPGRRMGHAGAIIAGGKGTAAEKMAAMSAAGIEVVKSPADIGEAVARILKA